MFLGVLKGNKKEGFSEIKHKDQILPHDLEKLCDCFSQHMAPSHIMLQRFVQFNLIFFLIRRRRENLTRMHRDTFPISNFHSFLLNLFLNKNTWYIDHIFEITQNGLIFFQGWQTLMDPDGLYIYQKIDEMDKNHNETDMSKTTEGRIYHK